MNVIRACWLVLQRRVGWSILAATPQQVAPHPLCTRLEVESTPELQKEPLRPAPVQTAVTSSTGKIAMITYLQLGLETLRFCSRLVTFALRLQKLHRERVLFLCSSAKVNFELVLVRDPFRLCSGMNLGLRAQSVEMLRNSGYKPCW